MLFSRFILEAPQTYLGSKYSHMRNAFGYVDEVAYYGGATVVNNNTNNLGWGLTMGSYINSENIDVLDLTNDNLFRHEYGHTLQSRLTGPLYLFKVGIPSFIGSGLAWLNLNDHSREWYETQANRMSFRYFSRKDPGVLTRRGWDDINDPRTYNPNWYWAFANPGIFAWWLLF